MPAKADLCRAEDAAWEGFHALVHAVPRGAMEELGVTPEWSAKDLVAHIGCWQAEAVQMFERMRAGTYRAEPIDVDAMNRAFVEANRPLPPSAVLAEAAAARTRMLQEFDALTDPSEAAVEWFVESGAEHYAEHVPRLRAWVDELMSRAER